MSVLGNNSKIVLFLFGFWAVLVQAAPCSDTPFNPVTDIAWQCIFPIRLGGVVRLGAGTDDAQESTSNPVCTCETGTVPRIGLKVSFWEPARIIDTVSTPGCMMVLGKKIPFTKDSLLSGALHRQNNTSRAFGQLHYYQFPAWAILDLFTDIPCLTEKQFDLLMMTEILPTWNNEALSLIINPEAVLFANPAAAFACMADAQSSLFNKPRNSLFWCMGSWGNAYPLSGSITATDYVEANAGLAARGIYLMGRTGLLKATTPNGCATVKTPIWRKDRYKLQLMKPVKDNACHNIGKSGLLWTAYKQPLKGGDNFSWMVFRKVDCCVSY